MMKSTCKQLFGHRLTGPIIHWNEDGTIADTARGATDINSKSNSYWNSLALPT
jgi:hypothetical protein